jgi:radical SAM protein (TIGR01212 family)
MTDLRYNTFTNDLRRIFGCRVQRVTLDAGFTCPNRDGTVGVDGCSYCGGSGAGAPGIPRGESLSEQLREGKEFTVSRYKATKFLAYFQAFSNTYGPVDRLRAAYDEVLADPDVVGLIIGTRPDCLPTEVMDLLTDYHQRTWLWVELGLQSSQDATLARIKRGHDVACFVQATTALKARGIRVCAHVILGLPGESQDEMLATPALLNRLGIDAVKLHHLHVLAGTRMEEQFRAGELTLLDRDDYLGLVCDFLERLDPRIVVQRLMGDGNKGLIAPRWGTDRSSLLNAITTELERRGTRQGSSLVPTTDSAYTIKEQP